MTQEEKARAYDEAIEKIKYVMEHGVQPVLNKEDLQSIFPELAESEDERIRKAIITFFESEDDNTTYALVPKKDILAWLEKQGEPKQEENDQKCEPFRIKKGEWYVCIHDFCNKAIRIGEIIQAEHDDTIRGIGFLYMENKYFRPAFENEIPQKPKWTDEDKEQCDLLIEQLATLKRTLALDFRNEIKWLKSLKQKMEEQ